MIPINKKILHKIQQYGRGYIFTPNDFLHLGTRSAIDTALSRLTTTKKIRRLSRGLYDYPKQHPILGSLMPSQDDIIRVISRDSNAQIQISGAKALYLLGLTTQVPTQNMYHTDSSSRELKVGNTVIRLCHASPKIMAGAQTKAGVVLQALRQLGKDHVTDDIIQKILAQLSPKDKRALKKIMRAAPNWTKPIIYKMAA